MDGGAALTPTFDQLCLINRMALTETITHVAAHRLATPLMYLSGNIRLIQEYTDRSAAGPLLEDILDGAHQIEHHIRDLRQWLQVGPGQLRTVSWGEVIEGALYLAHPILHSRAELITHPLPALSLSIDPDALLQIVLNLLFNAACAAELSTEAPEVSLHLKEEPGGGALIVSDSGAGVPASDAERVFEPFYSRWPHPGAGLGLSVSRALAERHSGTLTLENPGAPGARFILRFPAAGGATR